MSLYKRNNKWWMDVRINGVRKRLQTGTENRKLAEIIHAKVLTDIQEGKWFEKQDKARTLKEMIERYEEEYTDRKDYYQKARDKSIFKHLYKYFGVDATLQDVEAIIGGYEHHRRKQYAAPATIVKELGLLRRMFNIARKQWRWKVPNPVSDIELPKVQNERVRYLDQVELNRLFNALAEAPERWLEPIITIDINTGLRLTNVVNLMWSEVDMTNRIITLSSAKMKNNQYMGVPLTEAAYSTLLTLQKTKVLSGHVFHSNGQRLQTKKVQRAFIRVLKQANILNFHFHDLRHCYCSYLRQHGVDLHTISALAGHKDMRMTKRYSHLNVDNLRSAVSCLDTIWTQGEEKEQGVMG